MLRLVTGAVMLGFRRKGRLSSRSDDQEAEAIEVANTDEILDLTEGSRIQSETSESDAAGFDLTEDDGHAGSNLEFEAAETGIEEATGGILEMTQSEFAEEAFAGEAVATLKNAELHVGPGTTLKGDVTTCESLIVQGNLNGTVDAAQMQILSGGVVDGTATVQTAEVEGEFTGTLSVKGLLSVRGAGQIQGTIRYGELEIERGCHVSGDVAQNDAAAKGAGAEGRLFGRGGNPAGVKVA
jgi:cytoskeletal protein CcmA (bactofilin family)